MSRRYILSIDGGGIRGLIPAKVLSYLEQATGSPTARLFDLIAGTSTGGILALGLTKPDRDARAPQYSAEQLISLYADEGPKIFHPTVWSRITKGAFEEKYSAEGLEDVLLRYFGEARVGEALTDVMLTSYDIELRKPFFFKSWDVEPGDRTASYLMRDAARATSAAPSYFEPALVGHDGRPDPHALVDGGVVANSPSLCAFAEARRRWGDPGTEFVVISLGTGKLTRVFRYRDAKGWGALDWARRIIDVVFDGVDKAVDYQMKSLLPPVGGEARYHRFQCDLTLAYDDLDRADAENIRQLHLQADALIDDCKEELDQVCGLLLEREPRDPGRPR
jgi:patatin-like phospholipase/acyl hydrolase